MSNVDITRLVPAGDRAAAGEAARVRRIRAACRDRILALADGTAQINAAAAAATGGMSAAEMAQYRALVGWVGRMRERAAEIVADAARLGEVDAARLGEADADWPAPPPGIEAFARRY